jgi:hypothetical protein
LALSAAEPFISEAEKVEKVHEVKKIKIDFDLNIIQSIIIY